MGTAARLSNAGIVAGGLALSVPLFYSLAFELSGPARPAATGPGGAAEVAVFFNDPADWRLFRLGVDACDRRGVARVVESRDDAVVVETPTHRRRVRFTWRDESGLSRLKGAVSGLAGRPPLAVVGSDNTYWTAALAASMATTFPEPGRGPALLVPWATAVHVEGGRHLLDLYPGRTLRYAPDNLRQAAAVVAALREAEGGVEPSAIFSAPGRDDPYSVDLDICFREAMGEGIKVAERPAGGDSAAWASALWGEVRWLPEGRPAWLVLPLQEEPARRLLGALSSQARPEDRSRLRVLVADAVEPESLAEYADRLAIWAARPSSTTAEGHDALAPGEVVASLVHALDRADPPADGASLAACLRSIELPAAAGRVLSFDTAGERRGLDLLGAPASRPPAEPEPGR